VIRELFSHYGMDNPPSNWLALVDEAAAAQIQHRPLASARTATAGTTRHLFVNTKASGTLIRELQTPLGSWF